MLLLLPTLRIDNDWGFGQVVAIMVWVPSLVEHIISEICGGPVFRVLCIFLMCRLNGRIEGTAYKLAFPFAVMKDQPALPVNGFSHRNNSGLASYAKLSSHGATS